MGVLLLLISRLYRIEKEAAPLSAADRHQLRQTHARPESPRRRGLSRVSPLQLVRTFVFRASIPGRPLSLIVYPSSNVSFSRRMPPDCPPGPSPWAHRDKASESKASGRPQGTNAKMNTGRSTRRRQRTSGTSPPAKPQTLARQRPRACGFRPMPITIPKRWRSRFRTDGDHFWTAGSEW